MIANPDELWAEDFDWLEWLQVAAGRKGLFLLPDPPDMNPLETALLAIRRLPMEGEGMLVHKGGWLSSPERQTAVNTLDELGWTPDALAEAADQGARLDGDLRRAAVHLADVEARICERLVNEWAPNRRIRTQLMVRDTEDPEGIEEIEGKEGTCGNG